MLNQSLSQKHEQTLTARQIQQIKLLELPIQEIEERIRHELEENPALEEGRDPEEPTSEENGDFDDDRSFDDDASLGDYGSEDDIPAYKLSLMQEAEARRDAIPFAATAQSFGEYLLAQLELTTLSKRQRRLAPFVIGSISEDGYLRRSAEDLADDYSFASSENTTPQEIKEVIQLVQKLDPPGVGASDLCECLLLQLHRIPESEDRNLAIRILERRFDDFANKRFDRLRRDLSLSEEDLSRAVAIIVHLNPKPGNAVESKEEEAMAHITPDFRVEESDGELFVSLCGERDIQPLRVSDTYKQMLEDYRANPTNRTADRRRAISFAKQKVEKARWFIDAIRQRQDTLRRTMQAIVHLQHDFFLSGEVSDLKPMILKDVAELTHLDISTISRVAANKYVETDFGVFRLKYFFSTALSNSEGEEVSNKEVEQLLLEIVTHENKQKPLTDEALQRELAKRGFDIARRTVAKYRLRLGLPTARLRRSV